MAYLENQSQMVSHVVAFCCSTQRGKTYTEEEEVFAMAKDAVLRGGTGKNTGKIENIIKAGEKFGLFEGVDQVRLAAFLVTRLPMSVYSQWSDSIVCPIKDQKPRVRYLCTYTQLF